MRLSAAADGARWVLVLLLSLAAIEKAGTLRSRSSAWHPTILVSPLLRRHAVRVMGGSLVADLATVALLLMRPAVGGLVSAALVVAYSAAGTRAHSGTSGDGCRCFWRTLNSVTRAGFMVRNVVLLSLACLVAVWRPTASEEGLFWGGVFMGLVVSVTRAVDLIARPRRAREERVSQQEEGAGAAPEQMSLDKLAATGREEGSW